MSLPLMTQIFAFANSPDRGTQWPGAPFAVAAGFSLVALLLLRASIRKKPLGQLSAFNETKNGET